MSKSIAVWGIPAILALALAGLSDPVSAPRSSYRLQVVRKAREQLGREDSQEFVDDALGRSGVRDLEWCGLFALWALHQAGLAKDWLWEIGTGFLYRLPQILPSQLKPGDMVYFHRPYQHHAIVESVNQPLGMMSTINGNGTGGAVTRVVRPIADATHYYSIQPLVDQAMGGIAA